MQKIANCLDTQVSAFAELMSFRHKVANLLGVEHDKIYNPIYTLIK